MLIYFSFHTEKSDYIVEKSCQWPEGTKSVKLYFFLLVMGKCADVGYMDVNWGLSVSQKLNRKSCYVTEFSSYITVFIAGKAIFYTCNL